MITGVIVLNYNNSSDTINCVESILAVNTAPIKIVIVDNGSDLDDVKLLKKYIQDRFQTYLEIVHDNNPRILPEITLVPSSKNVGYACGNNLGLKLIDKDSEIDSVLIVNNDILFIEDIIPVLKKRYIELDKCGILSPLLYVKDGVNFDYTCARSSPSDWSLLMKYLAGDVSSLGFSNYMDSKYYLLKNNKCPQTTIKVDLPSGSCMFINKKLFREINWFDENTFLYYEENILYKKLSMHGKQNYILPNIGCIHLGASSTKSKPSSFLIKCNSDSAFYYLSNYCHLSVLQKMALYIAKKIMRLKYLMFKKKEKK